MTHILKKKIAIDHSFTNYWPLTVNRSWHISTTPNTTKIVLIIFRLIQQAHYELSHEEKSNFEFKEKKFSLLLKVAFSRQKRLQTFLFSNKLPRIQILIFLCKTTQNDHYRLLYKFETEQKNFWLCWELWICASFC